METLVLFWCMFGVAISNNDGLLRLTNSNADRPHSGFVQILVDGEWLDVRSSSWTITESDVVCIQLGYIEAVGVLNEQYHCATPATVTKKVVTDVRCTGMEATLARCQFSVKYVEGNDLTPSGVFCAVPFSLRLTNISSAGHADLEVLIDFQWELFCGDMFDQSYANVACRQLGYETGQYTEVPRVKGTYAYVNGTCSGHEFNLLGCANDRRDPVVFAECTNSVSLQCFSSPSKPCYVSSSQLSCDMVSIKWIFPMPIVDSYYGRYRLSNTVNSSWMQLSGELNTTSNLSTSVSVVITGLQPLLPYEVTLQGSNEYGNGTFSEPVEVTLDTPGLLPPSSLLLTSVNTESANISWQFQMPTCSFICLVGFDVHSTTGNQAVTHTFGINDLTSSGNINYMVHISGLEAMTTYDLKVRALASLAVNKQCIEHSGIINGVYSDPVEITTPMEDNLGFFDLIVLNNPYISLSLFIVTFSLVVVLLGAVLACCVIFRHCCRKKRRKIYQRRISNSDDNIYAAGDLSEQSYIPMVSSSVPNSLRITNRRVSNTPSISGPRSLWIDFPQPIATTFENNSLHDYPVVATSVTEEGNEDTHNTEEKKDDDGNDNPYDVIGKTQKNNECDSNITEEDDENLYDEIHAKNDEEDDSGSSKKDCGVETLPEAHRLSQIHSQESTDGPSVVPTIPPPREFAALPPVPKLGVPEYNERARRLKSKGLSVSMCNIPLPPLPTGSTANLSSNTSRTIGRNTSEGHWNANLDSKEIRLVRSRNRRQTVDADTRERYRAQRMQRGRRMSLEGKVHNSVSIDSTEAPYYSVPPVDNLPATTSRQTDDLENERSSSPEYEILLHPKSASLVTREIKSDKIAKQRPSRPPPPVPVLHNTPSVQGRDTP